jgi:raffinose/stachyose/melibiose transport system substrate-binding protein
MKKSIKVAFLTLLVVVTATALLMLSPIDIKAGGGKGKAPSGEIHWFFMNAIPYAEDWYREALDKYMEEHPGQSYEMTSAPWEEFYPVVTAAAAGEAEIDLIFPDSSLIGDLVAADLVVDITDMIGDTSQFKMDHPGYVYDIDGRLYGLAMNGLDTMAWFYNKDIFDRYGLDLPDTYEDLLAIDKVLEKDGIETCLVIGTPAFIWAWQWQQFLIQTTEDAYQYNFDIVDGKRKFTDPESVEAFMWLRKFVEDGIYPENAIGIDENTAYSMFITGKAALFFQGTWSVPIFSEIAGGTEKLPEIGVTYQPYINEHRRLGACGGFPLGITIYKGIKEEKLEPALDILRYMTSKEVTKRLAELDGAPSSSRKDVVVDVDPIAAAFEPFAEVSIPWSEWFWNQEVKETMWEGMRAVAGGLITPEEAAQKAQQVLEATR